MAPKDTTVLLQRLRQLMKNSNYVSERVNAYIVPSGDAHQSEYISAHDKRREFISGFSGSSGTAIITEKSAALWTDGRYFLQASDQLDSNWTLMKDGLAETPTQTDWLDTVLPEGGKVGFDPFLMSFDLWKSMSKQLKKGGKKLVAVGENLIDLVWDDQPDPPNKPILTLTTAYTGKSWQEKIQDIREKLKGKKCDALVLTALDDIAWLFNLRGSDIEYNPVFLAYSIVTCDTICLFIDERKIDSKVKKHLELESEPMSLRIYAYSDIKKVLEQLVETSDKRIWIAKGSSYSLTNSIPKVQRCIELSPIALMKAVKNETEIKQIKRTFVKDCVALAEYFSWLERNISKGSLSELSGDAQLLKFRQEQEDFFYPSFATISSSGPNGAIIHYKPTPEVDRPLTPDELYLCDSGGQYLGGTTDITRAMHFGTPTDHQRECFTLVLKGHIGLASCIFPNGWRGNQLDVLARTALWDVGLDYLHGTGHGVGAFLNVHEGPSSISHRLNIAEVPLKEGMIMTDEPGFYEDGSFGCRIENCFLVVKANTKYNFKNKGYLTFEPISYIPIQTKMLDPSLLSQKEIDWLNNYHSNCRDIIGKELKRQGRKEAYAWLIRETEPIG
ncbi:xaa-Pro aminopeptidase 1-like [Tubulanus polymorphus]|uniref:xaa-Pro aminopeptidase 1-like n=1 Tax=Tubulanus polymorphus TaxID=672921 RepID=UPI003DA42673